MRVVVTGGGTGGHVYPALAIASRIEEKHPGSEVMFIGSSGGIEGRACERYGIHFEGLDLKGLAGRNAFGAARALFMFLRGAFTCRRLLKDFSPGCVVGTGGFAGAPACFAAVTLGIPLILHEMNYTPGMVTRSLSRWAKAVAVSFPGTGGLLPGAKRVVLTGTPVRAEIERLSEEAEMVIARREALAEFDLHGGRRTLLVFGGSQGAVAINTALWKVLPEISNRGDLQVLHLTGQAGYTEARSVERRVRMGGSKLRYRPNAYTERMDLAYSVADLVLARAGAGTIAEIEAVHLPAVLVPYPYAHTAHQEKNAEQIERCGAAVTVQQDGDDAETAVREAIRLIDDEGALGKMRSASRRLLKGSGTAGIVALMEELS